MLQRAARNAYSWWWASHIRTKQSKWLDQNLQDMEEKVEYILKIINEDGDSFAVRAEMYYRKRPELVNFVEDCFRGYRALAERYDHLSRDLQSANRTIAAVYPERVQLSMDDEEEEFSFPAAAAAAQETNLGNFPTSLPDVPKVNLPKSPNLPKNKSKMPSRLMSKKGLVKIGGEDEKVVTKSSGLSKTEALEEIDKLQKGILTLQTEKEFIKSSYENGLARFWEIENRVTEMQAKVSNLQDEFGIGTVIEDDEARILMATAALKSCQETLAKLQEKRTQINKEAKTEYQRIYEARENFESIKEGNLSGPTNQQEISEESKFERESQYLKHLHEEAESVKQEMAKVEEQDLLGGDPVTISELAEKIDELVDKVIGLETEVTSQTSLVKRLRSETNELCSHLKSLEEDEEILIDGSDGKRDKIKRLEEELRRVQSLNQNVQVQNQSLQTHFLIASSSVDQLSENLVNVKPDEEVQNTGLFEEARAGPGEILFQHLTAANKKNDEIEENYFRSKQKGFFDVVVEVGQLKAASKNNREKGFKGNPEMMSLGSNSKAMITKDGIRYQDCPVKAEEENAVQSYQRTLGENLSNEGLVKDVLEDGQEKGFSETTSKKVSMEEEKNVVNFPNQHATFQSQIRPIDSMISNDTKIKEVEEKYGLLDRNWPIQTEDSISVGYFSNQLSSKAQGGDNFVPSSPFNHLDNHSLQRQMRSHGRESDSMIAKDAEEEAGKDDILGRNYHVKALEDNIVKPYHIYHEDVLKNGQVKDASEDNPEKGFKKCEDEVALGCDLSSIISKDGRAEEEAKKGDLRNRNHLGKADEDNFVEPYQSIQHEDFSKKGQVKYGSEDGPEKGFSKPEEGMALYNSMISEGRTEEEAKKDDVLSPNPSVNAEEDNTFEPYQSIQHKTLLKEGLLKDVSQDKIEGFKVDEDANLKEMNAEGVRHPHIIAQGGKNSVQSSVDIAAPGNGSVISNHGQSSSANAGTEDWYVSHLNNPFDDHYGIMGSWNNGIIGEEKNYHIPDSAPRIAQLGRQLDHSSEKGQQLKSRDEAMEELDTDEEDQPNWRHLFMYGLEDREKMLLEEYTSTLRNYKQVKKKLSEVEKKNRASLFKTTVQIKVLRSSNASKDAEIQSLHQKLNLFQTNIDETPDLSSLEKEEEEEEEEEESEIKKEEEEEEGEIKQEEEKEEGNISKIPIDEAPIVSSIEEKIPIDEAPIVSSIEEKIRLDIDDLLEEKIDFWLRFSITLHQIQKFQTAFHDLLTELKGVKEKKKQDGSATKQDQSEIRPIYKHLRDILTELTLWWENSKVLKEDLEHRLSSLTNIQDEISRLSKNGGEREEGSELSDYQAAKFQGEVMNMQQENKKVADELRVGADRVKRLQIDIEKTLAKLDEELGKSQQTKSSSSRSRIPLRSFLFGVKLRKQKPFFACMSPALQKQYSDLSALPR